MSGASKVSLPSIIAAIVAVAAVAVIGSHFTAMNRDWYMELNVPSWKPPDWVIPVAWNIIFILSIISIVIVWNTQPRCTLTYITIGAFVVNGILNIMWSVLFFGNRLILPAAYEAGLLFLSVVIIMILAWPISKKASMFLLPYAGWTLFATFLTWGIYRLNS
ncbi:MAG: TspO/MBR family protein [Armatimonadota bacterium]